MKHIVGMISGAGNNLHGSRWTLASKGDVIEEQKQLLSLHTQENKQTKNNMQNFRDAIVRQSRRMSDLRNDPRLPR